MKSISLLLAILAISSNVLGQTDKFSEAMKLKDASNYKDAFPEFQALMKSDSTNPSYLAQGSQVYTRYAYLYLSKEKQKQE